MSTLNNKVDFIAYVSVTNANPNGDPLAGNRPRTDYNSYGEISDVCIKRKIRNRMQDMGENILVKSKERSDDGYNSIKERIEKTISEEDYKNNKNIVCNEWLDVRSFGQVFSFKIHDETTQSVRGPVSIHLAISQHPVDIYSQQITKSVSNEDSKTKGSDTMGTKHMVRFGLYQIKGSINVQQAELTGFSDEDKDIIKECLATLFVNDASAARPDGSLVVEKLYWFEHNNQIGQYPPHIVHGSVKAVLKDEEKSPCCVDDYEFIVTPLEGLELEEAISQKYSVK